MAQPSVEGIAADSGAADLIGGLKTGLLAGKLPPHSSLGTRILALVGGVLGLMALLTWIAGLMPYLADFAGGSVFFLNLAALYHMLFDGGPRS